jgi:hypothetical protein
VAGVAVVLNTSDGRFAPSITLPLADHAYSAALGRLNADQFPDIVAAVPDTGQVAPLFNEGADGFTAGAALVSETGIFHVAAGDADGDSIADVTATLTAWGTECP